MSKRGWLLFAAMCVVWGVPYLFIRVAVRELSPATLVFVRTSLGALVLLPFAVRRGWLRPLVRRWRPLVLYSVIEVAVPWWLLTNAEQHLSSALAGLLIAAVPLIALVLLRLLGLGVGLAGVVALVGLQVGHVDLLAVCAVLLTAVGYAAGPFVLSRGLSDVPGVSVVVGSLVLSAVVWAVPAALSWPDHVGWKVASSAVALAVVCTAIAFLVFFALIAEVGPSRATVFTYVNPAVAILLGVALLGERFTLGMAVGFPLVLAGSVLATRRSPGQVEGTPAVAGTVGPLGGEAVVVDDASVSG
jgi:drug/metabolite transporter (DMT)-like permease